jgi:hypothetical protein
MQSETCSKVQDMARFEQQYTDDDFISAINGGMKTVGYILKKVGCARSTAVMYLERMEKEGKIEKVSIDDGLINVWKVKN